METGIPYNKQKLHHSKKYFDQLIQEQKTTMPDTMPGLLGLGRNVMEVLAAMDRRLLRSLESDSMLTERVHRLMTIPGVGVILALTWPLEIGDVKRFGSLKAAISYCGLYGSEQSSAGTSKRTPISKQRNKHLQSMLVEAAKVAPRWNPDFAVLYENEKQKGNRNRATLAVARKLVAYLLAIDRAGRSFLPQSPPRRTSPATENGTRKRKARAALPAGPRRSGDWATEITLETPTNCFRGRRAELQLNLRRRRHARDRKWMSGSANAGTVAGKPDQRCLHVEPIWAYWNTRTGDLRLS
jgi:hypothetical protein